MPIPNLTLQGGGFEDFEGNPLNLGYLVMELCHDENYSAGPYQIGSGLVLRIPLDASGNINPTVKVWSNDVLTPAGSCFSVRGFSASGVLAFGPQYWSLASTPNPLDVGTIVPTAPPGGCGGGSGGGGTSILLETNGSANTSQVLLNLVNSASVTFSNTSGGNVTATASGGGGGGVSGSGSSPFVPVWTGATTLANSPSIQDAGTQGGVLIQIPTAPVNTSGADVVIGAGDTVTAGELGGNVDLSPGHAATEGITQNGRAGIAHTHCAWYFSNITFALLAAPRGNPSNVSGAVIFCTDARGPQDGASWGSTAAGSGTGALLRCTFAGNWLVIG